MFPLKSPVEFIESSVPSNSNSNDSNSLVAPKVNSAKSLSTSVADNWTVTVPFSSTLTISSKLAINGASLTGVVVKMKDVISVRSSLSVTVTETELSPKKSVLGVIIRLLPSVEISVVKFSTLATLKVFVSPSSTSVADSGMVIEPSSSTV